jgi:ligand-binding SRPBCC domain-containing protein
MAAVWQRAGAQSAPGLVKHAHGLRPARRIFCAFAERDYTADMPQLLAEQFIPADPAKVWAYFATPQNLDALTPPDLKFKILGPPPAPMYAGQLIAYRISPLPGIWMRWLTEIRHVQTGTYFVDEQRLGPYRLWYHEHHFVATAGGVQMTDRVTYEVGWGPFGWLAEKLWVRRQLERIFAYRRVQVAAIFPGA